MTLRMMTGFEGLQASKRERFGAGKRMTCRWDCVDQMRSTEWIQRECEKEIGLWFEASEVDMSPALHSVLSFFNGAPSIFNSGVS